MKMIRLFATVLALAMTVSACQLKEDEASAPPTDGPPPIPAPADVAAPPADALRTPSGIASKMLIVGLGSIRPKATSKVTVHYTGWTTDGKMFDSSYLRGAPSTFSVDGVIPGWTEILQHMVVGEKRRVWIPANLAYESMPSRPQGMLVFEIELMDIR